MRRRRARLPALQREGGGEGVVPGSWMMRIWMMTMRRRRMLVVVVIAWRLCVPPCRPPPRSTARPFTHTHTPHTCAPPPSPTVRQEGGAAAAPYGPLASSLPTIVRRWPARGSGRLGPAPGSPRLARMSRTASGAGHRSPLSSHTTHSTTTSGPACPPRPAPRKAAAAACRSGGRW